MGNVFCLRTYPTVSHHFCHLSINMKSVNLSSTFQLCKYKGKFTYFPSDGGSQKCRLCRQIRIIPSQALRLYFICFGGVLGCFLVLLSLQRYILCLQINGSLTVLDHCLPNLYIYIFQPSFFDFKPSVSALKIEPFRINNIKKTVYHMLQFKKVLLVSVEELYQYGNHST
jgi:hypothetical protein